MTEEAASNLIDVGNRIARSATFGNRNSEDVTLIAVSKTRTIKEIQPLITAGQRHFGENRVQEAQEKWPALIEFNKDIKLHLVGQLQSNKAEDAVEIAHFIHSVDRHSLVTALARAMDKSGKRPKCFVQVNLAEEAHKGGCTVADLPGLLTEAREADLPVIGLMCVPPVDLEPAPWFALLGKLARDHDFPGLSMGMSGDFESAVKIGATHVRVGTALFGART
ncbi:YggS family pyridoxal phosphate-dependent enzyme [Sphingomonas sp.]|uniref:YggS family pyridoxal phosphate-dependent enzyme n=1 Tax=Sphingomonas sp. TaxID=28214 RepID=UPI0025F92298|nr:YggS family pyridoxal phosphate-dependent enzyme [Sphingomonas sp.]